ncbi:hypothetical protein Dvina_45045 [Dactylosporangium vinaceum]|uniref:Uncharacterized protein n=1 Tax=Dactylosporangium vinaceum TaxID=53362 RepID=A0ABV5MIM8_9ACTN|nr:hypothetical protein [Dactylosporangium vinaceum]UAB95143.1 hypothetical protein Dvina_45045 [Dactylosporangium vinaceum]
MTRYTIFATDKDGNVKTLKGDPAHLDKQQRDLKASGYSVTILDDEERIRYGLLAQQLRNKK